MSHTTLEHPEEPESSSSTIRLQSEPSMDTFTPSDDISWTFHDPVVPGPLPEAQITDSNLPHVFATLGRRREVKKDELLWERRDKLLALAENTFNRNLVPPPRTLNRSAEGTFRSELMYLGSVLLCYKCIDSKTKKEGYQLNKWKYNQLMEILAEIAKDRSIYARALSLTPPSIPSIPDQWDIESLWALPELEVILVAFREDVENYLAFW